MYKRTPVLSRCSSRALWAVMSRTQRSVPPLTCLTCLSYTQLQVFLFIFLYVSYSALSTINLPLNLASVLTATYVKILQRSPQMNLP